MECKIIFTGKVNPNFERESQLAVLAEVFDGSVEKAEKVLQLNKPVILKRLSNKQEAAKLVQTLRAEGLDVTAKIDQVAVVSANNSAELTALKSELTTVKQELSQLQNQFISLSEFIEKYVHKTEIDDVFDVEDTEPLIDNSATRETDDELSASADTEELFVDTEPTLLSRALPLFIAVLVLLVVGGLGWLFLTP